MPPNGGLVEVVHFGGSLFEDQTGGAEIQASHSNLNLIVGVDSCHCSGCHYSGCDGHGCGQGMAMTMAMMYWDFITAILKLVMVLCMPHY